MKRKMKKAKLKVKNSKSVTSSKLGYTSASRVHKHKKQIITALEAMRVI